MIRKLFGVAMRLADRLGKLMVLMGVVLAISGCSSRGWFDFGKNVGESKADCAALVSREERAKCKASFVPDYETYERNRDEVE